MAKDEKDETAARQKEESRQSARQGDAKPQRGRPPDDQQKSRSGIGSSQGQDRGTREGGSQERPSAGTPDIERGGPQDLERGGSTRESLVNDPTGAFKERP